MLRMVKSRDELQIFTLRQWVPKWRTMNFGRVVEMIKFVSGPIWFKSRVVIGIFPFGLMMASDQWIIKGRMLM
jgi:hypothetical protein